jgi:hypothetical protein
LTSQNEETSIVRDNVKTVKEFITILEFVWGCFRLHLASYNYGFSREIDFRDLIIVEKTI